MPKDLQLRIDKQAADISEIKSRTLINANTIGTITAQKELTLLQAKLAKLEYFLAVAGVGSNASNPESRQIMETAFEKFPDDVDKATNYMLTQGAEVMPKGLMDSFIKINEYHQKLGLDAQMNLTNMRPALKQSFIGSYFEQNEEMPDEKAMNDINNTVEEFIKSTEAMPFYQKLITGTNIVNSKMDKALGIERNMPVSGEIEGLYGKFFTPGGAKSRGKGVGVPY